MSKKIVNYVLWTSLAMFVACGGQNKNAEPSTQAKVTETAGSKQVSESLNEVRTLEKAKKLSNDATQYAQASWRFIQQVEPILLEQKRDRIEEQVRKPLRQISNDWLTEVKMTDAVTEGHYALCRKTLQSLDIWARAILEQSSDIEKKQQNYLRDKAECQKAIEHPELGNTDPKIFKN